jgi:hypothetical protein
MTHLLHIDFDTFFLLIISREKEFYSKMKNKFLTKITFFIINQSFSLVDTLLLSNDIIWN